MNTTSEDNQEPAAPDPQPSAPIEKMLSALDDLLAATRRVAVERSTTANRIPDGSQPSADQPPDSQ